MHLCVFQGLHLKQETDVLRAAGHEWIGCFKILIQVRGSHRSVLYKRRCGESEANTEVVLNTAVYLALISPSLDT